MDKSEIDAVWGWWGRLLGVALAIFLLGFVFGMLLVGCTAPTDPRPVVQPPLGRTNWVIVGDDPRDTFPDTLGDSDTLTYEQRGIPVDHRDRLPVEAIQ